ncbi:MAG: leucyl-tRNA synthetase, partial [Proteobacteria bacterium]|nr:leucyl-tRNA synthetase [Pseudomonadota bacterium]
MKHPYAFFRFIFLLALLLVPAIHAAELTQNRDPESGLLAWKKVDRGFSLELIQLLPEYVAALYSSRNLPPAVVDSMRGYCVFGSVAQNQSGGTLDYRVADWRVVTPDGKQHRLKTKPEWVAEWKTLGSDFGWSILPATASFDTG